MKKECVKALRSLEGRLVSVALNDGSRIDDVQLVSAGRSGVATFWIFGGGFDRFISVGDVVDVWEPAALGMAS